LNQSPGVIIGYGYFDLAECPGEDEHAEATDFEAVSLGLFSIQGDWERKNRAPVFAGFLLLSEVTA
jgi:hypothetical protein